MLREQSLSQLALTMVSLSKAAYSDDCREKFLEHFLLVYQPISNGGAFGHMGAGHTEVLVTFRGTNVHHIQDFAVDLDALPAYDENGFVHQGFKDYSQNLINSVFEFFDANDARAKDIYITGHSLGAAMALYVTRELEVHGFTVKTLMTFGQPRLGSKAFLSSIKAKHYRFVNCNDIVTRVPPASWGYTHHGDLCFMDSNGNIRPLSYWERFTNAYHDRTFECRKCHLIDGIQDHDMGEYIRKLTKIRDSNQKIV